MKQKDLDLFCLVQVRVDDPNDLNSLKWITNPATILDVLDKCYAEECTKKWLKYLA